MKKYRIFFICFSILFNIGLSAQSNKNNSKVKEPTKVVFKVVNSESINNQFDSETDSNQNSEKLQSNNDSNNYKYENDDNSSKDVELIKTESSHFFSIDDLNTWNLLSIVLSIISILLVILLPKKVIHQTSSNQIQSKERVQSTIHHNTIDPYEFEKRIRSSSKIVELSEAIHLLKNNPDRNNSNPEVINIQPENNPTNNDSDSNISTFYIYRPIDNYFSKSNVQLAKKDTLYKFIINSNNKNESSYELITDGSSLSPSDIAKRNETLIKTACEEENVPGDNVRNIITKRKGTVVLEGDKWIIKSKALIRYE